MSALLFFIAYIICNTVFTTLVIWLVCRLVRVPAGGLRRAAGLTLCLFAVGILGTSLGIWINGLFAFSVELAVSLLVIRWVLKTNFVRALAVWGGMLGASLASLVLLLAVVRPYMFESFSTGSNSMDPGLLGPHLIGRCPLCGGPLYVFAPSPGMLKSDNEGICGQCLQISRISPIASSDPVQSADRFFVDKIVRPRRWDIIAYRFEGIIVAKRLVGLPGETVTVKDDQIFIDGAPAKLPPGLAGLKFHDPPDMQTLLATAEQPMHLKPGEIFVLGDFTERSSDSRMVGAIPESDVIGVVTLVYWPLLRFQILR